MKDVVLVTNYWHFEVEKSSSRYLTLANLISLSGDMNLEIVTSSFYHATKKQRNFSKRFINSFNYKISLIDEPGYQKNVSIKRILSHKKFATNVIKYLKKRKKPDVIYCVVPSLDVADVVTKYATKNNIKLIIDVQDLWPEAFKMAIDIPFISDLLFLPMEIQANKIYSRANSIISVSESYTHRASLVNHKSSNNLSVYLGVELEKFDIYKHNKRIIEKPDGELWVVYLGTLGYSYDILTVIDALEIIKSKSDKKIKFIVIGNGPRKEEFENYAMRKNINSQFLGNLEYSRMVSILTLCDIAVNPIKKGSAASIINKHGDYLSAGLPIINTQESIEFRNLIDTYEVGINCMPENFYDMAEKFMLLIDDQETRKNMGKNSRKLAEEKFARENTYTNIVELIKKD